MDVIKIDVPRTVSPRKLEKIGEAMKLLVGGEDIEVKTSATRVTFTARTWRW